MNETYWEVIIILIYHRYAYVYEIFIKYVTDLLCVIYNISIFQLKWSLV